MLVTAAATPSQRGRLSARSTTIATAAVQIAKGYRLTTVVAAETASSAGRHPAPAAGSRARASSGTPLPNLRATPQTPAASAVFAS